MVLDTHSTGGVQGNGMLHKKSMNHTHRTVDSTQYTKPDDISIVEYNSVTLAPSLKVLVPRAYNS